MQIMKYHRFFRSTVPLLRCPDRRRVVLVTFLSLLSAVAAHTAEPVVITEFVASNSNGLVDEDGDASDWIEVFNSGSTNVNLDGWFLTDSPANLTKWRFPAVDLAP